MTTTRIVANTNAPLVTPDGIGQLATWFNDPHASTTEAATVIVAYEPAPVVAQPKPRAKKHHADH